MTLKSTYRNGGHFNCRYDRLNDRCLVLTFVLDALVKLPIESASHGFDLGLKSDLRI